MLSPSTCEVKIDDSKLTTTSGKSPASRTASIASVITWPTLLAFQNPLYFNGLGRPTAHCAIGFSAKE